MKAATFILPLILMMMLGYSASFQGLPANGDPSILANRPVLSGTEYTFDSPSGLFKLHWTDSGPDSTTHDYAFSLALAADSSWSVLCGQLGFYHPPPDQGLGGDDLYDIYVLQLASSPGFVSCSDEYKPPDSTHECSASHMVVSSGIPDADLRNCSVANLFFQAVGLSYDYNEAVWLSAGCSAWAEEMVFPDADAYLDYLDQPDPLQDPWLNSFSLGNAGFPMIWMLWDSWGYQSVRSVWEYCAAVPGSNTSEALESVLDDHGMTPDQFFMDYGAWRWFTGDNWFYGCGMYNSQAAMWQPGPKVLASHEVTSLPFSGGHVTGYEPETRGINWIRVDLSAYQDQWVEMSFDGRDDCRWLLGVILQDLSGNLYSNWYEADPVTGEKKVAVDAAGWDFAVFYPAFVDDVALDHTYDFVITALGTGIGEHGAGEVGTGLRFSSNPMGPGGTLSFTMPMEGRARVLLYDTGGRLAEVLLDDDLTQGRQTVTLDGAGLASGTYLVSVIAGDICEHGKLVLVR